MVSKITLFEPHFDGAQFGPASLDAPIASAGDEPTGESAPAATSESTASGGKSRRTMALQGAVVFLVMFVTLWVVLSRLLGEDSE